VLAVGGCLFFGNLLTSNIREAFNNHGMHLPGGEESGKVSSSPSYRLTAESLYSDYKANEVAADTKYKGKVIEVSGCIRSIGKDLMDNAYIVIGGSGFLDGVQCTFPRTSEAQLGLLSDGQQVTVKGELQGKMGNIQLRNCILEYLSPKESVNTTSNTSLGVVDGSIERIASISPSFRLTSEEIYSEYKANEVAADAKYKGKVIEVSGCIRSIGKDLMDNAYIVVGGEGLLDGVQCAFPRSAEAKLAILAEGQQVTVKGEVQGKSISVQLRNCSLEKSGTGEVSNDTDKKLHKIEDIGAGKAPPVSPMYRLTAENLYSEYKVNEIAAGAKYKGKVIVFRAAFGVLARTSWITPIL